MKNILRYNGNDIYKFNFSIKKSIKKGDFFICLLDTSREIFNENVICVNLLGNVIWSITPIDRIYENSPYVNICVTDEGLKLVNWNGTYLIVNYETGSILYDSRKDKRAELPTRKT